MAPPPYRFPKSLFSSLNEELVRRLREARKRVGLSQVEAAARLGCRQTFISKIECGERRLDVAELLLLLHAYRADPGEFLRGLAARWGGGKG